MVTRVADRDRELRAALAMASMGWAVFPVDHPDLPVCRGMETKAHDPQTCTDRGKHPTLTWSRQASKSPAQVRKWFGREGDPRNIGVHCGRSGLVVIDEDERDALQKYAAEVGEAVPATYTVQTHSGFHYYFIAPRTGNPLTNAEGALRGRKLNVRAGNGYVVGAGSTHRSGTVYRCVDETPPVELPAWLLDAIRSRPSKAGKSGDDAFAESYFPWRDDPVIHHPDRNNALASAAGYCRKLGMDRKAAVVYMRDVFGRLCRECCPSKPYVESFDAAVGVLDNIYRQYPVGKSPDDDGEATTKAGELNVGNAYTSALWLRDAIGTGPLAGMFRRGERVVHTPRIGETGYLPLTDKDGDDDGPAQVREASADYIAARISYTYNCYKHRADKNGDLVRDKQTGEPKKYGALFPAAAAKTAVNAVDMLPRLQPLRGVTHTPTVRADGSILDRPGYDETTRLLYLPEPGLEAVTVPDKPTRKQVREAVKLLDKMTAGFPFRTSDDRANFYGLLITPLLRELTPPPYKLGVVTAPMRRSGKTLLASLLRILHGGVLRVTLPPDEAEWFKTLSTVMTVTTGPVVTFDNVTGKVASGTLDGLLTSDTFEGRHLGTTKEMISCRNDRLWTITSNNAQLGGDLVPRALWVSIEPKGPHPERRTGFAIDDLPGWVRKRRGDLLAALLTIVRYWVVSKVKPDKVGDIYGRWVGVVRSILTTAGVPGTFDSAASMRQDVSEEDEDAARFCAAVRETFGTATWLAGDVLDPSKHPDGSPFDSLADVVPDVVTEKPYQARSAALGKWLGWRADAWFGDSPSYSPRRVGKRGKHGQRWRIVRDDEEPTDSKGVDGVDGVDVSTARE